MKRIELVKMLVKEGMSEKTLVNFSDRQLEMLSEKLFKEATKGALIMSKTTPLDTVKKATESGVNVELREKLVGKQKNIDKNKNGKIDAEDFELLKKKEKLKEWIDVLVDKNYHSVTTKADILETISKKVKETANPMPAGKPKNGHNGMKEFMEYSKPETKPEEKPDTETIPAPDPDKTPSKPKIHPGKNPNPGVQPGPKAKKKKDVKEITPEIAKKKVIGAIGKVLSK